MHIMYSENSLKQVLFLCAAVKIEKTVSLDAPPSTSTINTSTPVFFSASMCKAVVLSN